MGIASFSSRSTLLLTAGALIALASCEGSTTIQPAAGGGGHSNQGGHGGTASAQGGMDAGGMSATSITVATSGGGIGDQCPEYVFDAEFLRDPIDVIFVVDNSGSMATEIGGVEQHLQSSLIQPLTNHGLDHRVIVVGQHGPGSSQICVPAPLSGNTNCAGPPVNVADQFYHYSVDVGTHDALCKLLETVNGLEADEYNLAPGGWSDWLRPEALKAFIAVSDDGVDCQLSNMTSLDDNDLDAGGQQVATTFEQLLLTIAPDQFGTSAVRHYVFYGLLGMVPKNFSEPIQHYEPQEPVTQQTCASEGSDPGTGYQWLSKNTDALRFPACNINSYPIYLPSLASDLNEHAVNRCRISLPEPPGPVDLAGYSLLYHPGDNGLTQELTLVQSPEMCGPGHFYLQDDELRLCEAHCAIIGSDPGAQVQLRYQECPPPEP